MTNRMAPAQRRQHYDNWLASGMSKSTYAHLHGINTKNNRCEQMMHPVVQGRKSWLFAGSLRGEERMAELIMLLHTARLNGPEPVAWLRNVPEKRLSWPASRLDELLPYRRQMD